MDRFYNQQYEKIRSVADYYGLPLYNHNESIDHMIRCSHLAIRFGTYIQLKEADIELLGNCALLHDIGKLRLSPSILYKQGKLNNYEFNYIRSHIYFEAKVLNKIVQDCIRFHHERFDGKGYNGLDNKELHDFVHIISLIDCYDAMTNSRSYRLNKFNKDFVINEIRNNIGKQFDMYYGNLFLSMLRDGKYNDG